MIDSTTSSSGAIKSGTDRRGPAESFEPREPVDLTTNPTSCRWRSTAVLLAVGLAFVAAVSAAAQERVDRDAIAKIRDEGFHRSQVMELASYLADVFGPRLAGSPSYRQAAAWAKKKLEEFGLVNAALEPWGEYGMGWENQYTSIHMMAPVYQPIIGYPRTGSHGTGGRVRSSVIYVDPKELCTEADLARFRGRLKGKIVLTSPKRTLTPNFAADATRLSKEELRHLSLAPQARPPEPQPSRRPPAPPVSTTGRCRQAPLTNYQTRLGVQGDEELQDFFADEGVAVLVYPSNRGDMGTVYVYAQQDRRPSRADAPRPAALRARAGVLPWHAVPSVVIAAEHYNRMMRILEKGIEVVMEVETRTAFNDDDLRDYNVVAEIPGTDRADEVVMLGAHLDARSGGTGGTDAGAGSAAVMEAVRILKAAGLRPRRTIRAALWGAEEPAILGSRGYVYKHFGNPDTQEYLPEHAKLAAYFNLDEGAGRIRGIFLQGNERARPIFDAWMRPFHDLGMTTSSIDATGGTDHLSFAAVGLPGFQFIQDDLELSTRTHHSNMDVYDRIVSEDLITNAVILASFAYHAAMRDERLPRIPPVIPEIFRERPFER